MSTTSDLITALKAELRAADISYAALAQQLCMAESSVKRMFSRAGDMPLSSIDEICRALGIDFAELARRVADAQPLLLELTAEQEEAVVADRRLLLVATCCLSQWSAEQIVATYAIEQTECVACLARLDRLGIIELRPLNRYRLRVAKGFRWRPNGPVMAFFRDEVVDDYFDAGFDDESELLLMVHGQIAPGAAAGLRDRLARIGQDFSSQHLADRKLSPQQRRPYTLVVAMRSWLMASFRDLLRDPSGWPGRSR